MASVCNDIPSLPFELQLLILSQTSFNQIFTLRRVSRAWHAMLSNPNLESALMDLFPFLTTAPNLTALAKRRCRIMRGDPVAIFRRPHYLGRGGAVTLFQDGYDVLIRYPSRQFIVATPFFMQMTIKAPKQGGKQIAQAELLAILQTEFPEIYARYVGDPRKMNVGTKIVAKFMQIHDNKLMVVLEISCLERPFDPDNELPVFQSLCMVHIFFFSLETGSVINSLAVPAPNGYQHSVLAAFNGVLVTVGWIRSNSKVSPGTLALSTFLLQTKSHKSTFTVPNYHREFPFHLDRLGNLYFPSEPSDDGWYKAPIEISCISAKTGDSHLRTLPVPISGAHDKVPSASRWRLVLGAVPLKKNRVFAMQLPDIGADEYENARSIPVITRTTFSTENTLAARHMTMCIPLPAQIFRKAIDSCVYGIYDRYGGVNPEKQHPLLWGRIWDAEARVTWWGMLSGGTGFWGEKLLYNDSNSAKLGNIPLKKLGTWVEGDDGMDVFCLPIDWGGHRESELTTWGVQNQGSEETKGSPQVIVCWDEEYTF